MSDIELPRAVVAEIEAELNTVFQARINESAKIYQGGLLVWKAGEDQPPRHSVEVEKDAWAKRKYHGEVAENYDAKREQTPKWLAEQAILEDMLSDLQQGDWVLDCPVGTGRLIPFYEEKGVCVHAVDISRDMLAIAAGKRTKEMPRMSFTQADILTLSLWDNSVDTAVMVRLTRWLTPEQCQTAFKHLQRVARKKIILTARVANHPHARPLSLFEDVMDGWTVTRNEGLPDDPDYRVIMLSPVDAMD